VAGPPQGHDAEEPSEPRDAEARLIDLAHDLRTPLAIVVGFTELLLAREDSLTPEQRHDYVERAGAAAADMRAILDAERARRPPS
jgi:signal transduction histidine kinase